MLSERKGKVIFHVDGPKTEKAREPTAESLVPGIWRLRYQKRSGEYGRACKVEDSHRDKMVRAGLV